MEHIMKNKKLPTQQAGFTLIEVMVVIVILGILAGVVVPQVLGSGDQARVGTTKTVLSNVSGALDMYKLNNHKYPTSAQGLQALITQQEGSKNWPEGGYLKGGIPKDGWDNEIQYLSPGTEGRPYDLYSFGADGKPGGEGIDADIEAKL